MILLWLYSHQSFYKILLTFISWNLFYIGQNNTTILNVFLLIKFQLEFILYQHGIVNDLMLIIFRDFFLSFLIAFNDTQKYYEYSLYIETTN